MTARTLSPLLLVVLAAVGSTDARAEEEKLPADLKDLDLDSHPQLKPVKPVKEPATGFVVGGKNATSLIKGLTHINGRTIAELEADMRPGAEGPMGFIGSRAGFLGEDEKLLDVLAEDNRYVVEELGLTHQALARAMKVLAFAGRHASERRPDILYHGRRFDVTIRGYKGSQDSPFRDMTSTSRDVFVTNLDTNKRMWYSLLVPEMIERYGFYEGEGTEYRVEPREVVEVMDFLLPRKEATPEAKGPRAKEKVRRTPLPPPDEAMPEEPFPWLALGAVTGALAFAAGAGVWLARSRASTRGA